MRRRTMPVLLGLVAAALLGSGTAGASSGLELSVATGELARVRADSTSITFTDSARISSANCQVQTTRSLHRTIRKSTGFLYGVLTDVRFRNCSGGQITAIAATLPWHSSFQSFAGTLPNPTSLRYALAGVSILVEV